MSDNEFTNGTIHRKETTDTNVITTRILGLSLFFAEICPNSSFNSFTSFDKTYTYTYAPYTR